MNTTITSDIITGAVESAVTEVERLIARSAMSPAIREKHDYFIGVFTPGGAMVHGHVANSGPGLLDPILAVLGEEGPETSRPGDVWCLNDPYIADGAIQHLPDIAFVRPVFHDGAALAWIAAFGHFHDIGSAQPGSSPHSTNVFQEGILIPPVRVCREGRPVTDMLRLLRRNSRFPDYFDADSRALMAACELGGRRISELAGHYGADTVAGTFLRTIEQTRSRARTLLEDLVPFGEYSFTERVETDGQGHHDLHVDFTLARGPESITADLTATSDQTAGPINFVCNPRVVSLMVGRYLTSVDPTLTVNEGLFQLLDEVRLRPGSLLRPAFPAPVALRSQTSRRLVTAIAGALAEARGGNGPAAMPVYVTYSLRSRDGADAVYFSEGLGTGLGGRDTSDGPDVIYGTIAQRNFPVEFVEATYPLRIERYEVRRDSGGPGRHRGGCGAIREVRVLFDGVLTSRMDNGTVAAWGLAGGLPGRTSRLTLNPGTPGEKVLPGICDDQPVTAGDLLRYETAGGGGWGDPRDRPAEAVLADVRAGLVSPEGAARDYGVIVTDDGPARPELRPSTPGESR